MSHLGGVLHSELLHDLLLVLHLLFELLDKTVVLCPHSSDFLVFLLDKKLKSGRVTKKDEKVTQELASKSMHVGKRGKELRSEV